MKRQHREAFWQGFRETISDGWTWFWLLVAMLGVYLMLTAGCVPDSKRVGMDTTDRAFDRTVALQQQAATDFRELGLLLLDHAFQRAEETGVVIIDHFFTRAEQWQAASVEQISEPRNWLPIVALVCAVVCLGCAICWAWHRTKG